MLVDVLSVGAKALAYLSLLQAAGAVLFLATTGKSVGASGGSAGWQRLIAGWSLVCVVSTLAFLLLEAGRMTGELSSIIDPHWLRRVLRSTPGVSACLRLVAMALLAVLTLRAPLSAGRLRMVLAVIALLSLLLYGHSSTHPQRWLLAPLLALHLLVAAWWFGSLFPLASIARTFPPVAAKETIDRYSAVAGWVVPALALAGLLMAVVLTEGKYALSNPYDAALTGKVLGFSALMGIAALNRWRLGPALASGEAGAVRALRLSLGIEWLLIAAVVVLTATMTSLYSPEVM